MTTETNTTVATITPVSEETKSLVEQKMPNETDAIKQKMGELVDLIKQRAEAELRSAEGLTREAYIKAMNEAKATLNKTQTFFQDQEKAVDQSIHEFGDEANRKWDGFVSDMKQMGDRVDRAVNAAWKELSESGSQS